MNVQNDRVTEHTLIGDCAAVWQSCVCYRALRYSIPARICVAEIFINIVVARGGALGTCQCFIQDFI